MRLALRPPRFSHTAALAALFVLISAPGAAAGAVSEWLAVQDPADRCPALVVLNGDYPARANEAARLYREGVAREVWLTDDPRSGDGGADAGTRANAKRLVAGGVPAAAIHVVPGAAAGTRAELQAVIAEVRRRSLPCAVLITSPLHGRRVSVTWRHVAGTAPRGVVRHAADAEYWGWWVELKEVGLTILALIGLPR